jgi:hypothetical protein
MTKKTAKTKTKATKTKPIDMSFDIQWEKKHATDPGDRASSVVHRDPSNGATWKTPNYTKRRVELQGYDVKGMHMKVERVEDARRLVIWLEDDTEVHIELFERVPNMLDIRTRDHELIVWPMVANMILVGRRS